MGSIAISMIFLGAFCFCLGVETWSAISENGTVPYLDKIIRWLLIVQTIYASHKWYQCARDWRESVEQIREEIEKATSLEDVVVIAKSAEEAA